MGGGSWSTDVYASTTGAKVRSGTTFAYSRTMHATPSHLRKAHESLDPKTVAGPSSPLAGKNIRESRDSDDHPLSVPLAVGFDQTGSMGGVPRTLQTKLAELFGVLLKKGYVEDPQIAVSAYGDVLNSESSPLQFSQFESDNRIDDSLDNLFLEGMGGGNMGETGQLVWWFAAKHTATDAWEKRGKKGYLFTIGDEVMLPVPRRYLTELGIFDEIQEDLTAELALKEAQKQWDVYHLLINNSTAHMQRSEEFYSKLLGDHLIVLEDADAVTETIAMLVGLAEGTVDLDEAVDDLKAIGASASAVSTASKALTRLADAKPQRKLGQVIEAEAPADIDEDNDAIERV